MKQTRANQIARGLLPYAATILSLSAAITLRVEHSCSESSAPASAPGSPMIYPYPLLRSLGVVTGAQEMERHIRLVANHPAVVGLWRDVK